VSGKVSHMMRAVEIHWAFHVPSLAGLTVLFGLVATIAVYLVCRRIYRRWPYSLLSPMFTSLLGLILLLTLLRVPYATYMAGAHYLTGLLQPATVAFAIPLYRHRQLLRRHAGTVITCLGVGILTAVASSMALAEWLHLGHRLALSLAPRSITTPVAIGISQVIGGNPVLTAVFVILTGMTGILIGPLLIRAVGIRSAFAKGALMGMGAHGIGTSKAFEFGPAEGTISSLSMVMAALMGVFLTPWIVTHWPLVLTPLK
jgi:predicted murein hydrolase (TIGR00659 family)